MEREPSDNERAGMAWWNSLSEAQRLHRLQRAGSAVPAEAWACLQMEQALQRAAGGQNDQKEIGSP